MAGLSTATGPAQSSSGLSRRLLLTGGLASGALFLQPAYRSLAATTFPRLSALRSTIIVGSDVGGTYDLFARTLARHFERVAPGLRIDIKFVPQASGKLAAKMLQEGPTDGSMLFISSPALLSAQVLAEEGVAFDLSQWSWVGKISEEARFLVSGPGADFKALDELRAKTTPSPLSARSTSSYIYHEALWTNAFLGLRIKPVPGYKSVEKDMAVVNGEVMLTILTFPNDRKLLDLPEVVPILRTTNSEVPDRFKDVPLLSDLIRDRPDLQPSMKFMDASTNLQRWFAAPPKTDPEVLTELRTAFDLIAASPELSGEAEKLDLRIKPLSGQAVADAIGGVLANQHELAAVLSASLACGKALSEGLDGSCAHS